MLLAMVKRQQLAFERALFLEGPAGSGKTTATANFLKDAILTGEIAPDRVLILVPQLNLAEVYQSTVDALDIASPPTIVTHSGLARRMISLFWPLVARSLGVSLPAGKPVFLNYETAQYFMARFADPLIETGLFDSLSISKNRLIAQILDNTNKATLTGLTGDEAEERLGRAWGQEQGTSRRLVYKTSADIADKYRNYCLENKLLDYAMQIEFFNDYLLGEPAVEDHFRQNYTFLIADNIEEMGARTHDLIAWSRERMEKSILLYDRDGGYRLFLGADPANAYTLREGCDSHLVWNSEPAQTTPNLYHLVQDMQAIFDDFDNEDADTPPHLSGNHLEADLRILRASFYPDMLRQCGQEIHNLIRNENVQPSQVAIVVPYLSDSLRLTLASALDDFDIPYRVLRPSRPIVAEPSVRAVLTLVAVAYPQHLPAPPVSDVETAFATLIDGLDPVRARLLVQIVYRHGLSSFLEINDTMRQRITEVAGQRYEYLRRWLEDATAATIPLDYFMSRLFGEVLSQAGYGFYENLDAGRAIDSLIRSAQVFRQTVYPEGLKDWLDATHEFLDLLNAGLIAARYEDSSSRQDAVCIAPTHTILTQNMTVDYQFWLDIGHSGWSERLEQPLTHPYVLRRSYQSGAIWTDEDEQRAQAEILKTVTLGLLRRCRKRVVLSLCDLNEMGYEQHGPLARVFHQLLADEDLSP